LVRVGVHWDSGLLKSRIGDIVRPASPT
jgi:hypothetical protein